MNCVKLLQEHKIGLTDLRLEMIEKLSKSKMPMCFDDFNIKANKTTFYRNMELFINNDLVVKSEMLGKGYYELKDKAKAYFVCHKCHEISNITLPKIDKKNISSVVVEGLCDKCE